MKKYIAFSLCSIFVFALVITVTGEEQIPESSLKDGDFWQFRVNDKAGNGMSVSGGIIPNGTYVIRFSEGGLRVSQLVGDQETSLEQFRMLNFLIGRNRRDPVRQNANSQDLNFPLFVGKQWQYAFDLNIPKGTRHRMVGISVTGHERIQTPAGNFEAFKIEKTVFWPTANARWGNETNDIQAVYFYSPEAKCIVKYSSTGSNGAKREIELLKVGSSKEAQAQ